MANRTSPKTGFEGRTQGSPYTSPLPPEQVSYRDAAVGCWWIASGVRGVEPVGMNQGRRGQNVRDLAGHPDYTAPPAKDAVTPRRTRK